MKIHAMRRTRSRRPILAVAMCCAAGWLAAGMAAAEDEDAEIVVGCHFSMGEWGYEGIQMCIRENQAARAEVKAYPEQYQPIVERCARRRELGWGVVKKCVDDEIAAGPALRAYEQEHGEKLAWCRDHYRDRGDHRIRLCVEQSIAAEQARERQ